MSENKFSGIIIPMTVLAYYVKENRDDIPRINPNYESMSESTLGNDITPRTFNSTTSLQQGIHLHFVLPPAFKHGIKGKDSTTIEYPRVPDRYIVTRMYVDKNNGKIVNDCNIVDSTFYSANSDKYQNKSITIPFNIPFQDDFGNNRFFRYLGRQFSGFNDTPKEEEDQNEGHINELFGVGPGDPLFNAYYPNCCSVFGYYDDLNGIFNEDGSRNTDRLTYSVIGYYSNKDNDPFSKVNTIEEMKDVLTKYNLIIENDEIYNSCLLFGEVCNINLDKDDDKNVTKDQQGNNNNLCLGIGRTSAEALSAIIYRKYSNQNEKGNTEQFLTEVQYDMVEEASQIDGQYKVEDNIHSYSFTSSDPLEKRTEIVFAKDTKMKNTSFLLSNYADIYREEKKLGKLRRTLEFKKNSLYYLWEMYIKNKDSDKSDKIIERIRKTITEIELIRGKDPEEAFLERLNKEINDEIELIRSKDPEVAFLERLNKEINDEIELIRSKDDSLEKINEDINDKIEAIRNELIEQKITDNVKIEEVSTKPFFYPKDPALMLYGDGIKDTFTSKDADQENESLYCLTSPLSSDDERIKKFRNEIFEKSFNEEIEEEKSGYLDFIVMTVLLDKNNSLPIIGNDIKDNREPPPENNKMVNNNPNDELVLFMEWETGFYNNYKDCDYKNGEAGSSTFEYDDTDYKYKGEKLDEFRQGFGLSLLTPHGISNFKSKLEKYNLKELAEEIDGKSAVSQNLGGFTIDLTSLRYAFQLQMSLYTDDVTSDVQKCLYTKNNVYYEPDPERLAINGSNIIPLRDGFLDIRQLSIVTSFGNCKYLIKDDQHFPGTCYISENLRSNDDYDCILPLALTTPARLSSYFISAASTKIPSCSLPGSTPIIAIIMPDILNRNLNIYDNTGTLIGVIKRAYIDNDDNKIAVGQFMQICNNEVFSTCDKRIRRFIDILTDDKSYTTEGDSYLSEIMNLISQKLDNTVPMYQNDFIFGRILALAEINIELEYFGGTEFVKDVSTDDNFNDKGLMNQKFPVMIGDINRYSDGVICGFYGDENDFENGFATFGYKTENNKYLKAVPPMVSGEKSAKVTLLLDPSQNVTLSTGFLPVEQVRINARHTDFSNMNLMSVVMDTLITEETKFQAPDFTKGEKFTRKYPILQNGQDIPIYKSIDVVKAAPIIDTIGETMITDGFIAK